MAAKCPICKVNKMHFGGMAALDGTYCGKCYDKALKKGIDHSRLSTLKIHEIAEYIREVPAEETSKWMSNIDKLREEARINREIQLPYLEEFRKSNQEFFAEQRLEENASLQNYATQIFWHVSQLRKMRLLDRGITVIEEFRHNKVTDVEDYREDHIFDGKYDVTQLTETIEGSMTFQRDGQTLYQNKKYNLAKYILQDVHKTDHNDIVCPSCGKPASRSNLIDGCDFCGAQFSVEDLGLRVAEYHVKENIDVKSYKFLFSDKDERIGSIVTGLLLFFLGIYKGLFASVFSGLAFLIASPLIGWLVYLFVFKFAVVFFNLFRGNYQSTLEYEREEMRRNEDMLKKIRSYDALFTLEEFYAEVKNMITAHYYARSREQIRAFWHEANEQEIDDILQRNKNVVHVDMLAIGINDYIRDDEYQHITLQMTMEYLKDDGKKLKKEKEDLSIRLVKSASCKTQAVCGPKMLTCPGCGASISMMEGGRCHYCGKGVKLSELGWALEDISSCASRKKS